MGNDGGDGNGSPLGGDNYRPGGNGKAYGAGGAGNTGSNPGAWW